MSSDAAPLGSILVVDDTVENLRLLASMLGETGYEIRAVTSGRQALQAVEHDPPDLLLLDINMPEMSGYEVCAALKARPEFQDIPVVFVTASSETADKVRAFEMGGVDRALAMEALAVAAQKLPLKCKIVEVAANG